MKRNCNYCRALESNWCALGYKIGVSKYIHGVIAVEYKPLENCPKPKTYDEYFKAPKKQ